jgi:hypothetical protein
MDANLIQNYEPDVDQGNNFASALNRRSFSVPMAAAYFAFSPTAGDQQQKCKLHLFVRPSFSNFPPPSYNLTMDDRRTIG